MYGTGTWDLFINDIASFSAGDILIGGKSFSTKTAGEGFLMRIDKYGKITWQKIYQSAATGEDSIDKVGISNDFSFAVGHSTTGSANTYFLLKFAADGTSQYNVQIGGKADLVGTDSVIVNFVVLNDATANIYYDGSYLSSHYTSGSYVVMDGSSAETVVGLKGNAGSTMIRSIPVTTTVQLAFSIFNNQLFTLSYDSTNLGASTIKILTNNVSTLKNAQGSVDMDLKSDNSDAWIAVISSDSSIYGFHTSIPSMNLDIAFKATGISSTPTFINVLYVDGTH